MRHSRCPSNRSLYGVIVDWSGFRSPASMALSVGGADLLQTAFVEARGRRAGGAAVHGPRPRWRKWVDDYVDCLPCGEEKKPVGGPDGRLLVSVAQLRGGVEDGVALMRRPARWRHRWRQRRRCEAGQPYSSWRPWPPSQCRGRRRGHWPLPPTPAAAVAFTNTGGGAQ